MGKACARRCHDGAVGEVDAEAEGGHGAVLLGPSQAATAIAPWYQATFWRTASSPPRSSITGIIAASLSGSSGTGPTTPSPMPMPPDISRARVTTQEIPCCVPEW